MTATRYELDYAARVALARSVALEHELACAQAEVARLRSAIRNHRAQKGFNGKIGGDDHRLWEAAGLGDAGWAEVQGDL